MTSRFLIVNADDFGLTAGVNEGIIRAHEQGIVTSASLMVRGAAAVAAADYAKRRPQLGVGLHVDLCEWRCVNDTWELTYEVVPLADAAAVKAEIHRQLDTFRQLMGRKPDHLDSHQHVHNDEPARAILVDLARELGVVLRHADARVNYCGDFYGQSDKGYAYHDGISVGALIKVIQGLPAGVTELCCHPGMAAGLDSVYGSEREMECASLCDPQVRAAVAGAGVTLGTFSNAPLAG